MMDALYVIQIKTRTGRLLDRTQGIMQWHDALFFDLPVSAGIFGGDLSAGNHEVPYGP